MKYSFFSTTFPALVLSGSPSLRFLSMKSKSSSLSKSGFSLNKNTFTPLYKPKNENQIKYVDLLNHPNIHILLGVGPAGTGKTLFACSHAIQELKTGNIDKIILTRPVVPVEEDIGFLPGNLVSKMDPWTRPIFDIFLEYYSKTELDTMVKSNVIEISPLAFMRGRTFKRSFIIADEMQNSSPNQMFMLATRIGEHSKMVITGDLNQSDRGKKNGLFDLLNKIKYQNSILDNIGLVEFQTADIERSAIVRTVMHLYQDSDLIPPVVYETNLIDEEKMVIENILDSIDETITHINNVQPIVEEKYNNVSMTIETKNNNLIREPLFDAALIPKSHFFTKNSLDK